MASIAPGRAWDEASSASAAGLARRFEQAWRAAPPSRRPDPLAYLPREPDGRAGAVLALLRAELGLRRDAGEPVDLAAYRDLHPDLGDEGFVAIIYEDFCLREDAGEAVEPADYHTRFPDLSPRLRRVFDIHGLIGAAGSTGSMSIGPGSHAPAVPFPEAGQTIAGFHLVEELGRGAFARVFLAQERQLADRPVALKVARAGSREPQTLARLQHTHIVPVHSYRTDPATGLHLLCMPYFGRVTLAQLLADGSTRRARSGADLIATLDRLGPRDDGGTGPSRSAGRLALAGRSYARAIAWWGARLAEALEHAHDRGVLHRDIKPSNVLLTDDGMPMLLDFNLAGEPWLDDPGVELAKLGGTLDYMAPEHLEALADGLDDGVDARSDLYSLGVVLHEALAGSRPFAPPADALTITEALLRSAEERTRSVPSPRRSNPEVPPALDAVVRRCLAPSPGDRYATAGELAADLHAVADDRDLPHAREPIGPQLLGWARRRWRKLAAAAAIVGTLGFAGVRVAGARIERDQLVARIERTIQEGAAASRDDDLKQAADRFAEAEGMARGAGLAELQDRARHWSHATEESRRARCDAAALLAEADDLHARLLAPGPDRVEAAARLAGLVGPFYAVTSPDWARRPELGQLAVAEQSALPAEVDELLYAAILAEPGAVDPRSGLPLATYVEKAVRNADDPAPWRALRDRLDGAPSPEPRATGRAGSATSCAQWAMLLDARGDIPGAIGRLERAARLRPDRRWYRSRLAALHRAAGNPAAALAHAEVAVALAPDSPRGRLDRARLLRDLHRPAEALDDLDSAARLAAPPDLARQIDRERAGLATPPG